MHSNLEQQTTKKGTVARGARNLLLAGALAWGAYHSGKVQEAKHHSLEHRRIQKGIYELISEEGYNWKKESDHKFFEYNTMVVTNPETKEMWGIFFKEDSTHTGRIRYDGKVGDPFGEQVRGYTHQEWNEAKQSTRRAWEQVKGWFRQKREYTGKDRDAEER